MNIQKNVESNEQTVSTPTKNPSKIFAHTYTGISGRIQDILSFMNKVDYEKEHNNFKEIDEALEALSVAGELVYHSPEKINKKFEELGCKIPKDELDRMKCIIGALTLEEVKIRCAQLKEHTEGNKPPLLLILPKRIILDGKTFPFTIENVDSSNPDGIWKYWQRQKSNIHDFTVLDGIETDIKQKEWGDKVVAFTSDLVKDSTNKRYLEQITLVVKKLGTESEIHSDMHLAMIIHYLQTGKILFFQQLMRLHDLENNGNMAICVGEADTDAHNIRYGLAHVREHWLFGIGASFTFSTDPSDTCIEREKRTDARREEIRKQEELYPELRKFPFWR